MFHKLELDRGDSTLECFNQSTQNKMVWHIICFSYRHWTQSFTMKDENNLFVVARVKWNPNKQTAIMHFMEKPEMKINKNKLLNIL